MVLSESNDMAYATPFDYSTLGLEGQACTRLARNNFTTKHKLRFKIYLRDGKQGKQSHQNWATLLENIIRVFGYFWN